MMLGVDSKPLGILSSLRTQTGPWSDTASYVDQTSFPECKSHFYAWSCLFCFIRLLLTLPPKNCLDSQKQGSTLCAKTDKIRSRYNHQFHLINGHSLVCQGDLLLWRSCSSAWRTLWGEGGGGRQVVHHHCDHQNPHHLSQHPHHPQHSTSILLVINTNNPYFLTLHWKGQHKETSWQLNWVSGSLDF